MRFILVFNYHCLKSRKITVKTSGDSLWGYAVMNDINHTIYTILTNSIQHCFLTLLVIAKDRMYLGVQKANNKQFSMRGSTKTVKIHVPT